MTPPPTIRISLRVLILLAAAAVARSQAPPSAYGFNTKFNSSTVITVVVLIAAFFFIGFFSLYIRQCSGTPGSLSGGAAPARFRRAARGLDAAVIETFPTFEYSVVKNLKLGKGTLECAVCLSEFEDDETLRLLPKCSHVFHPDCIDAWLAAHTTCPVCRCDLVADGGTAAAASDEVAITIDEEEPPPPPPPPAAEAEPAGLLPPTQNRPPRARSTRKARWSGRFPRSHSTGHSLVQAGENVDRFTLRLPDHIRRELIKGKLNRTASCVFPSEDTTVTDGSVRRGEGTGGGRALGRSVSAAAKSDRWIFSVAPAFLSRTFSIRSASRRGVTEAPSSGKSGAGSEDLPAPATTTQRSATSVFTVETPQ